MTALPPLPTAAPALRWGVVGTGGIAGTFVEDLRRLDGAHVAAVGSRSRGTAERFAERHGIPTSHGSYDELVTDPDVQAVYVATPHSDHHATALAALEAGKAVLVEKPFTLNAAEAVALLEAARQHGCFLMEAMWTRFLPHVEHLRDLLASGALGVVRTVTADFGFRADPGTAARLFDPALGGGALLDLGVYPVSLASMVLGVPSRVMAVSSRTETGVDAQTSVLLDHEGGAHALLTAGLEADSPHTASIVGSQARVDLGSTWFGPAPMTLTRQDGTVQQYDVPDVGGGQGMWAEAAEVARCVADGRLESSVMPLDESVSVMRTLDEVRRQIGLTFPQEQASS